MSASGSNPPLAALALLLMAPPAAYPEQRLPAGLAGVGLDQKLNEQVPLDLTFRDEKGESIPLRRYFRGRPVILSLVYYQCPMLCTLVLNGIVRSLRTIDLQPGRDFELVTLSFDPKETPRLAEAKKRHYVDRYGRPEAAAAWHFLTGDESSIDALTRAVGFRYRYDQRTGQFAHPSAIALLTPVGKISRYFYGIDYSSRDLRLGLVEASAGKIGSKVDQVLLFCYHYDPATGKYSLVVWNIIRTLSCLLLAILCVLLWKMFSRDRRAAAAGV